MSVKKANYIQMQNLDCTSNIYECAVDEDDLDSGSLINWKWTGMSQWIPWKFDNFIEFERYSWIASI